jgi:hypothetical protein
MFELKKVKATVFKTGIRFKGARINVTVDKIL